MRGLLLALTLVSAASAQADTLTFDVALQRAMRTRGVDTAFARGISQLEAPFGPMLPTIRAEAAAQRAGNSVLMSNSSVRFDAQTLLLAVDYPLFEGAQRDRRLALARTSAQLFRRRALDEADEVFRETLDSFTDLYAAQQRLRILEEGVRRAATLRERARTLLALGQITTTTAASWEEQALATESRGLDHELARFDAETRLKQLTGDTTGDTLLAALDVDGPTHGATQTISLDRLVERDPLVDRATLQEAQKRLVVEEMTARRRPQFLASAFGGVATVPNAFRGGARDGSYGIYGVRLTFTLPSLDAATATRIAEPQLELEEATRRREAATAAARTRGNLLSLSMHATEQRIAIVRKQIDLARKRQESMTRLVLGGVRTEAELFDTVTEVARRESELLAIRVERWRLAQTARQLQKQEKAVGAGTQDGAVQ